MLAAPNYSHIVMPLHRQFTFLTLAFASFVALTQPVLAAPPFLRARGNRIVNEQGERVVLRGFNLGGWLLEEMWMSPFVTKPPAGGSQQAVKDAASLWSTIEARFGRDEAYRLKKEWRSAWLSEADFHRIKAGGFNCVRLPFIYDAQNEPDGLFTWLDRAVNWAEKAGIYLVLDMHGAPGRQSKGDITGQAGVDKLFKEPRYIDQTATLWQQIAKRYRNRSVVAAYDLLNEPMGAPNPATLHGVHDRLYRAIREVDKRHLIVIEDAYKGFDSLPYPSALGWENVLLSLHSYDFDAKDSATHRTQADNLVSEVAGKLAARGAPFYLGEFNVEPHGNPEVINYFVTALQRRGYSWSFWTYKVAGPPGGRSTWGWFYPEHGFKAINPFTDTPAQMREKFSPFRTENMTEYVALKEALHAPTFTDIPVEGWRVAKSDSGEESASQYALAPAEGWRAVKIGEDVFDGKLGFAWFRCSLPTIDGTKKSLLFDAADDNATVYLNGHRLMKHEGWSGAFEASLDQFWQQEGPNEVAVLVENAAQGGGLTGPVSLSYAPAPRGPATR
jgi:endoglucanase